MVTNQLQKTYSSIFIKMKTKKMMKISFIILCLLGSNSIVAQQYKIIDNDTVLS